MILNSDKIKNVISLVLDFCEKHGFEALFNLISDYNKVDIIINSVCCEFGIKKTMLFNHNIKNNDPIKMLCFILLYEKRLTVNEICKITKTSKQSVSKNVSKAEFYLLNPNTNPIFSEKYKIIKEKL